MKISGLIGKLLAGTANLLNKHSKTQERLSMLFENGKVTEVIV